MNLGRLTLRITANGLSAMCLILLYSLIGIVIIFGGNYTSVLVLFFTAVMSVVIFCIIEKSNHQEAVIIILLLITAFQNVFMALFLDYISSDEISFLVIINYLFTCIIFIMLVLTKRNLFREKYVNKSLVIILVLVIYSLFLLAIHKTSITAFFASFRNITCPLIYYEIGLYISEKADLNRLTDIVLKLSLIIFILGLIELFVYKDMWLDLNISELWDKKGIYYDILTGRPYNHYSAEIIFGAARRRMVSTFAEPVNLGTFFLLCFFLAFWKRKKLYMLTSVIGCVMTISKGALLGILLLGLVWSFYHLNKKSFIMGLAAFCVLFVAIYFGISSAGDSMSTHINGFISSLESILENPMGVGIGNAGVYGNLINVYTKNQVQESGLGVVIGQLGIIGLVIYALFFFYQYKAIHMSRYVLDERMLIFSYSMIFAYILLIIFSESALGPNASAGFMIIIGVLCQRSLGAAADNLSDDSIGRKSENVQIRSE